jgi:glycosyltransferase involved in cell wall biosynthesis
VLDQVDPARTGDRIVLEEEKRYPQLSLGSESVPEEFYRRLDEEWSDSDVILVNSAWSRDALVEQGALSQKIQIVPLSYARNCPLARQPRASSLRVLWLGTLGLGKGLHYAIDSARLLVNAPVQFTFCGPLAVRRSGLDLPANSLYLPRVARGAASSLYAAHDIFLLPTLSDGFAITQIEAMSFGLPVIATRCCGDVVQDGISGHFVPCRDARAIASTIETFLAKDVLERMSAAALTRSEDFLPERIWPLYQRVFEGPESFPSEARAT